MHKSLRLQLALTIIGIAFNRFITAHSIQRNPLNYYSVVQNIQLNTPSYKINYGSKFELEFDLHGGEQKIRLTLVPNDAVIQEDAIVQYMAPDGSLQVSEYLDRREHRVYMGNAWVRHDNYEWTNVGWARIYVLRDGYNPLFEGVFRVDGDHHHIQTSTHYIQTRHRLDPELDAHDDEYLVVWRDSDISPEAKAQNDKYLHQELKRNLMTESSCSADRLGFNTQLDHPIYRGMAKRDDKNSIFSKILRTRQIDGQLGGNSAGINLVNYIGSTSGCPTTRRVALVGIATDCTYTAAFSSPAAAKANIINVINSASQVFESSFNITLGLQNLTISDSSCPTDAPIAAPWNIGCSDSIDIQDRLNLFSAWRGERKDNNAYWTLLSTCGTGSAVGLAWLGQACVNTVQVDNSPTSVNETVSGANVVVRTGTEWQVIAHETGHTFGAVHDCTSNSCSDDMTVATQQCCPLSASQCDAGGSFIMNPKTGPNIQIFSPCTIGNICSAIGRNSVKTNCLTANRDITTITGSQCGNGIVEPGEDCDCGGVTSCGSNPCCDPATCKFKVNAVCDPSNEDCCNDICQFKSSSSVCRPSKGSCDPAEMCDGNSATCPRDSVAPDGTKCGNSTLLSCASGQCTSRDLQCKALMGVFTQGNDTYACSTSGCQISCASPEFGANVCYSMQQNFLDGTSCQGGGKCMNGICFGASISKEIKGWVQQNKNIVIVAFATFGCFILIVFTSCCINSCRRKREYQRNAAARKNRPPTLSSEMYQRQQSTQALYGLNNHQVQSAKSQYASNQSQSSPLNSPRYWEKQTSQTPQSWQTRAIYK